MVYIRVLSLQAILDLKVWGSYCSFTISAPQSKFFAESPSKEFSSLPEFMAPATTNPPPTVIKTTPTLVEAMPTAAAKSTPVLVKATPSYKGAALDAVKETLL